MKKANFVRVSAPATCFVLLMAVGILSMIEAQVSASQKSLDCKNDAATRDRVMAAAADWGISDLKIMVEGGKVKVEGLVRNTTDLENYRKAFRSLQDPCIRKGGVNTDGLKISCTGDQEILKNVNDLLSHLRCSVSEGLTVSIKDGVATIAGTVPNSRYKTYLAKLVESADCVKAGVINNLVVSPTKRFSGDCSRLSDAELQKVLEDDLKMQFPCEVFVGAKINVANGVATLSGGVRFTRRAKLIARIKSLCPGFFKKENLVDTMLSVDPTCPSGAKSCTTPEGEYYCCTGCRVCPVY